jgi:hypothetical protein
MDTILFLETIMRYYNHSPDMLLHGECVFLSMFCIGVLWADVWIS